jgi:hypothetical protein
MELYNMSPRSFYGFNKKMVFLQGTARLFFENYKRLEDQCVDILDAIFLIQNPKFTGEEKITSNPWKGLVIKGVLASASPRNQ